MRKNLLQIRIAVLTLGLVGIAIFFNNCQQARYEQTDKVENGTSVGNPFAAKTVLSAVCSVINRCHSSVTLEQCQTGVSNTGGFESALGLATTYSNFSEIVKAEELGTLQGSPAASSSCYTQVNNLDCMDPTVQSADDSTLTNPFTSVPDMIPINSCNRVFVPLANLEVPIEMIDNGAASKTTPIIFSRSRTSLDTGDYDGTVTYFFEVVATNMESVARTISLVNNSGIAVGNINIPANTTNATRLRTNMTPTTGANEYRLSLPPTGVSENLVVFTSRIIVRQIGATKTKIYVPLTGHFADNYSSADDSSAAVDRAGCCNSYTANAFWYRTRWKKNSNAFKDLTSGLPYTLEAVISTEGVGSTATAALINTSTGLPVLGSETSTNSNTPTLVKASFADNATNFTDQNEMEFHVKNFSGEAFVYKSGLWISLTNIVHGEVYYRLATTGWGANPSGGNLFEKGMSLIDTNRFTPPFSVYHELAGFLTELGSPCTIDVYDRGILDSAFNFDGSFVAGSDLTFTTLTSTVKRSAPLSVVSGNRFVSRIRTTPGPGACISLQPRIVVGF